MFPNYETMKIAFKKWKLIFNGWSCLKESRNKAESKNTIDEYFKECKLLKRVILFAVCRGNYAEGFNFSGKKARAVFLIGVPNLNIKGIKYKMKKIFYKRAKTLNIKYDQTKRIIDDNLDDWYDRQRDQAIL